MTNPELPPVPTDLRFVLLHCQYFLYRRLLRRRTRQGFPETSPESLRLRAAMTDRLSRIFALYPPSASRAAFAVTEEEEEEEEEEDEDEDEDEDDNDNDDDDEEGDEDEDRPFPFVEDTQARRKAFRNGHKFFS
ncbi:hypothetical protein N0V90_005209 [Kalmusia sp. IMI 367209]|nr:hypothetical protein N0V90_005209 [Kalmusia sp. IMI 367209]